jgi:glycosyltransferase involved in cell wall biosynthesis
MRVGIDARFLTHPQMGGFKTYTESLIAALGAIDGENEYLLYVDRVPVDRSALPSGPNFLVRVVPGSLPLIGMPWREQVGLAAQARRDRLDVLHALCLTAPLRVPCPLVVTIHDMIWAFAQRFAPRGKPTNRRALMQWYYRLVPALAAKKAAAVITVSHAAKRSIVESLGIDQRRLFVTHEAASEQFRPLADREVGAAVRAKYGLDGEYILGIGSADPRKNIATLLQAYAQLPEPLRDRYRLAIVWTHALLAEELAAQAQALGIDRRLHFLRKVPTDDLVALYNEAALFAFPSQYEGFGLPLLEAMACGAPVVAANNSSIPEIVGDAGLLVPTNDVAALMQAMRQVLTDEYVRRALVAKGRERAASFSWQKCAAETLAVYRTIAQRQPARRAAGASL